MNVQLLRPRLGLYQQPKASAMLSDTKAPLVKLDECLHSMDFWIKMTLCLEELVLVMFCQDVLEIVCILKKFLVYLKTDGSCP